MFHLYHVKNLRELISLTLSRLGPVLQPSYWLPSGFAYHLKNGRMHKGHDHPGIRSLFDYKE